jgi:type VI secretion system protein ImpM
MNGGFGAFGKIPALGDFFRLNVGQTFVVAWDQWLQDTLLAAQTALGGHWDDRYMSAPIWRFSLAAGLAGPAPVIGVLMPSVDRVGRKFPLTLVCEMPNPAPLRTLALQDPAFTALEHLAILALDDDMTQDRLTASLKAIVPTPEQYRSTMRPNGVGYAISSPSTEALYVDVCLRLGPSPASAFLAVLDGSTSLLAGKSLPDRSQASALFDLTAPLWNEDAS